MCGFDPWVRKIPCRREWQPTPACWPVESHGQRSLVGYSPWGRRESDMTERLRTHARVNKASMQTVLSMSLAWFSVLIHSNSKPFKFQNFLSSGSLWSSGVSILSAISSTFLQLIISSHIHNNYFMCSPLSFFTH